MMPWHEWKAHEDPASVGYGLLRHQVDHNLDTWGKMVWDVATAYGVQAGREDQDQAWRDHCATLLSANPQATIQDLLAVVGPGAQP